MHVKVYIPECYVLTRFTWLRAYLFVIENNHDLYETRVSKLLTISLEHIRTGEHLILPVASKCLQIVNISCKFQFIQLAQIKSALVFILGIPSPLLLIDLIYHLL